MARRLSEILEDIIYDEDFLNDNYSVFDNVEDSEDEHAMRMCLIDGFCMEVCIYISDYFNFKSISYHILDDGSDSYHYLMLYGNKWYDAYDFHGVKNLSHLNYVKTIGNYKTYTEEELRNMTRLISTGYFDYIKAVEMANAQKEASKYKVSEDKNNLFESQKSNLGSFIQELNGIFDVRLHNYNPRENGRCLTYITTDTFDKDNNDFKSLMDKHQVFISSIDEFDVPDGTIQVNFESKYPEDVTKNVYRNSRVLYHLTRPDYIKKIAEEGIKPLAASEFRRSWYPERIYLLTDRCTTQDIKTYARQLGTSYIVICDIKKMGYNYDFYKDPQSLESFSVFTDKTIPSDCISIMRLKDFYDNKTA